MPRADFTLNVFLILLLVSITQILLVGESGREVELVTSCRKAFTPQSHFIVIVTAASMHLWENPVNYC